MNPVAYSYNVYRWGEGSDKNVNLGTWKLKQ